MVTPFVERTDRQIIRDVLGFAIGNVALNFLIRCVMNQFPSASNIPVKKRRRSILYIISTVNSIVSSGYGIHHFLTRSWKTTSPETLKHRTYQCICFVTGYFVADFLFVLPEAATYPNDIVHHLIGIALGFGALRNVSSLYSIVPVFSLQEISTVPLNLMWGAKEFGGIRRWIDPDVPKAVFFFSFLATRLFLLPLSYYRQWRDRSIAPSRGVHVAIFCFVTLQYYWGYGILRKAGLFGRKRDASRPSERNASSAARTAGTTSPLSPSEREAIETC